MKDKYVWINVSDKFNVTCQFSEHRSTYPTELQLRFLIYLQDGTQSEYSNIKMPCA